MTLRDEWHRTSLVTEMFQHVAYDFDTTIFIDETVFQMGTPWAAAGYPIIESWS